MRAVGDLRLAREQGVQFAPRPALGEVLEGLAPRDHEHDDDARKELADQHRRDDGHDSEHVDAKDPLAQLLGHLYRFDRGHDDREHAEHPARDLPCTRGPENHSDQTHDHGDRDDRVAAAKLKGTTKRIQRSVRVALHG